MNAREKTAVRGTREIVAIKSNLISELSTLLRQGAFFIQKFKKEVDFMKRKGILKRMLAGVLACTMFCGMLTGCTEAEKVSYNISEEADNFNIFRRVVVVNVMSDKVLFELDGYFSINSDNVDNQLEITCEVGDGVYKKHFIGLSEMVAYTVEDINGAKVDKYHYEIHYLPEGNVVDFEFKESD